MKVHFQSNTAPMTNAPKRSLGLKSPLGKVWRHYACFAMVLRNTEAAAPNRTERQRNWKSLQSHIKVVKSSYDIAKFLLKVTVIWLFYCVFSAFGQEERTYRNPWKCRNQRFCNNASSCSECYVPKAFEG